MYKEDLPIKHSKANLSILKTQKEIAIIGFPNSSSSDTYYHCFIRKKDYNTYLLVSHISQKYLF